VLLILGGHRKKGEGNAKESSQERKETAKRHYEGK